MAGTFPGICNTQQQDIDGAPLDGGQLYVFNGGTQVLSTIYQDIGLSILSANPLACDASGRIPMFFVPDGTYRVRLIDVNGTTTNGGFDYPQVPSIGASSSGGGGSSVDPTTIFQTGDPIWVPVAGVRTGWTRMNGRTIGSAISGAGERASADCQAQFVFLWNNFPDSICPVLGGRGANALADFNANKQITTVDMRAAGAKGLDDMGNAAAALFTGVPFVSGNATTAASVVGENTHLLVTAEIPSHNHTLTDPGHTHPLVNANGLVGGAGGLGFNNGSNAGTLNVTVTSNTTGITIAAAGGGGVHNTTDRNVLGTWYMKL